MIGIFAIDPGLSTGVAFGFFDEDSPTLYAALKSATSKESFTPCGEPLEQVRVIFRSWRSFYAAAIYEHQLDPEQVHMVMEDFILSPTAPPGRDILYATKVAHTLVGYRFGGADEFERILANPIAPVRIAWQTASEAKSFVSDKRLRRWGLWVKGKQHERDAFRHLAFFLNRRIS